MKIKLSSINSTALVLLVATWGEPLLGVLADQNVREGNMVGEGGVGRGGGGGERFESGTDEMVLGVSIILFSYITVYFGFRSLFSV